MKTEVAEWKEGGEETATRNKIESKLGFNLNFDKCVSYFIIKLG